ncbi:hypothetical protein OAE21_02210 [Rubripirellula sp.]|nr:hypothetical protein [Rubripirellula sp.]MDB4624866.1 hypothetical protein [Rubripirellula sp.]
MKRFEAQCIPTDSVAGENSVSLCDPLRDLLDRSRVHFPRLTSNFKLDTLCTKARAGTAGLPRSSLVTRTLAGIQTNPPETNEAVASSGIEFGRTVDIMPTVEIQQETDTKVDMQAMHDVLMKQGVEKFVKPQRALLSLIAKKRSELTQN